MQASFAILLGTKGKYLCLMQHQRVAVLSRYRCALHYILIMILINMDQGVGIPSWCRAENIREKRSQREISWVGDGRVKNEQIGEQAQENFNAKSLGAPTGLVGISAAWRVLCTAVAFCYLTFVVNEHNS